MQRSALDPVTLAKISNMLLRARFVVEGVLSGLHKSPHRGSSVEFVEHKEYSPGDEIKHVDWKAYGKFDKYYVKQFEEETNLRAYILLDTSGSMDYKSGAMSKLEYSATLASSLAYLMLKQADAVGLLAFSDERRDYIPPRSKSSHLQALVDELENIQAQGSANLSSVLNEFAEKIRRRSLIMLISDLLGDGEHDASEFDEERLKVVSALKQFRHRKHEIVLFHVLDSHELTFPFENLTLFRSMEGPAQVLSNPRVVKEEYLSEMNKLIDYYRTECLADQIDYKLIDTSVPLDQALSQYLAARERFLCSASYSRAS